VCCFRERAEQSKGGGEIVREPLRKSSAASLMGIDGLTRRVLRYFWTHFPGPIESVNAKCEYVDMKSKNGVLLNNKLDRVHLGSLMIKQASDVVVEHKYYPPCNRIWTEKKVLGYRCLCEAERSKYIEEAGCVE
jgi:hypothetical protein